MPDPIFAAELDALCTDIEAGRAERRYRAWELQAKARFINGEVDAEIRFSREHPQVTAHGSQVDSDPLPPHDDAVTWSMDFGQDAERAGIIFMPDNYIHAATFSVGASNEPFPDFGIPGVTIHLGADEQSRLPIVYGDVIHLRAMGEAFEALGSEIARVVSRCVFSDFVEHHTRQAEASYLSAHRRLPGSMKTKRLRKKRLTRVWRWYMAQHHGR